jgi:hypothetical protein
MKTKPKRKHKSLSALKKQAWDLLSKVIRGEASKNGWCNCYTCGKLLLLVSDAQAGHAIGGRHNAVLFDEEIIRVQCAACNIFKRGNYQVFITKLIEENGFAWWQRKLIESGMSIKYDRSMLAEKIESYKERLAKLA